MPDEEHIVDAHLVDDDEHAAGPEHGTAIEPAREPGGAPAVAPEQIAGGLMTLYGPKSPQEITAEVTAIANELKSVVDKQNLTASIPGRDKPFLEVEAWQVCGTFLGVQPHIVAVEPCEPMRGFGVKRTTKKWGKIDGKRQVTEEVTDVWMAKGCSYRVWCEARTIAGAVVGKAVGFCSREEKSKIYSDEYEIIGMASTRAVSRTLRQSLAFIVAMAGYATTPASEMAEAPPNAGGPPFGPELTDEGLIGKAREALAYLLATGDEPPDEAAAERVWGEIEEDCSGYMPVRVARGLLWTAAALKKKVEGGGAEPAPGDDDKRTEGSDDDDASLPEVEKQED